MKNSESCYESVNLMVRRKPKENNFRAVLETIRSLINTEAIGRAVPAWLYDVILGYGNPASAHYRNMPHLPLSQISSTVNSTVAALAAKTGVMADEFDEIFDYVDTFLSADHVVASFPNADVSFRLENGDELSTESSKKSAKKSKEAITEMALPTEVSPPYRLLIRRGKVDGSRDSIVCVGYNRPNKGPYPENAPPMNSIRFTDVQVEAIRSGVNQVISKSAFLSCGMCSVVIATIKSDFSNLNFYSEVIYNSYEPKCP